MSRCIRRLRAFCLLLLIALLVCVGRIQAFTPESYAHNPADRRAAIARYSQPRGDILAGEKPVTGSLDTGQRLRFERTYRQGPLYAPVTGYSSQLYGTSQLEAAEDAVLSGSDPRLALLPLWYTLTRTHPSGGKVRTTIDPAVQRAAFTALGRRTGAVAALEPATGRILALVSTPSYDPGELSGNGPRTTRAWTRLASDAGQPMLNRALRQTYPPGSTFKVVTAAAALEHGTVTDAGAPTDTASPYRLPGTATRLRDLPRGCARASLRRAFTRSCNSVFARLAVRTGLRRMVATAEEFGFNDSRLTIPSGVARSTFDTRMDDAQLALSAIGQYDTAATPLQMAMVAAAVANGGTLMRPRLVDRLTDTRGFPLATTPATVWHRPMTRRTAAELRRMMVDVVTRGAGGRAAVPGAVVGGKTGTAQHGPRNAAPPYAWFIGWAQRQGRSAPAIAVAVVVEHAHVRREDTTGGTEAAPIARAVLRAGLHD